MKKQDKKKRNLKFKQQEIKVTPPPAPLSPLPHFDSPKRTSVFKVVELKSTAIAKSPFSKMIQELDGPQDPLLSRIPRNNQQDEMIYLRTPDNRQAMIEMKMAEKLDFDIFVESARKELEVIPGEVSEQDEEYDYEYEPGLYDSEEGGQEDQDDEREIPAQTGNKKCQIEKEEEQDKKSYTKIINSHKSTKNKGKMCCNCKKSRCLKLYCQCFRNNQMCAGCNCVDCHNTNQFAVERYNAYVSLMEANPHAFLPRVESQKHTRGCNCKKSNCQKRYCECFQAGLSCTEICRCEQCKNTDAHGKDHKKRHNILLSLDKMAEVEMGIK